MHWVDLADHLRDEAKYKWQCPTRRLRWKRNWTLKGKGQYERR
jgi:hypothetical protein